MITQLIRDSAAKGRLTEAFFQLCAARRIQEITINDITRQAGLSRGSFHFYYNEITDILHETEKLLDEMASGMLADLLALAAGGAPPLNAHKPDDFPRQIGYLKTLLGENGDPAFRSLMHKRSKQAILAQYCLPQPEAEAALSGDYIAGGLLALLTGWLQQDCLPPLAQLAEIVRRNLPPDPAALLGKQNQ